MGKSLSDALKKAGLEVNSTESPEVAREPLTLAKFWKASQAA